MIEVKCFSEVAAFVQQIPVLEKSRKTQSGCICQLEIFPGDQKWGSALYLLRSVRGRLSNWMAWRPYRSPLGLRICYQQTLVILSDVSARYKGSFMWWCPKAGNVQSSQQQYDFYCQETFVEIRVISTEVRPCHFQLCSLVIIQNLFKMHRVRCTLLDQKTKSKEVP